VPWLSEAACKLGQYRALIGLGPLIADWLAGRRADEITS
jgi:hypothetical protein